MFFLSWKDSAPEALKQDWERLVEALHALEVEARDAGDPALFHGTSLGKAGSILADGTATKIRVLNEGGGVSSESGLYFGTLSSATAMTEAHVGFEDKPAILAVRVSDLMSAGRLLPDCNILDCGPCRGDQPIWPDRQDPGPLRLTNADVARMSWEESLYAFGTLAWGGQGPISGMALLDPAAAPDLDALRAQVSSPGF